MLEIQILDVELRVPYGINNTGPNSGVLAPSYPGTLPTDPVASGARKLIRTAKVRGREVALFAPGINVEIGNWRGVYGAPDITPAQRKQLTDAVLKAVKTKAWAEALEKNNWTPALMAGAEFEEFVDREFASLRATMVKAGMV